MYLQAVSRSSGAISDQQLAEIEKRKEEVKQVTRAGSVRDSRNIFESGDSVTLGPIGSLARKPNAYLASADSVELWYHRKPKAANAQLGTDAFRDGDAGRSCAGRRQELAEGHPALIRFP
jgi:hypothetical protein